MVMNQYVLGLTFHAELSGDTMIHEYFLSMVGREGYISTGSREWYVSGVA
jgi:5'-phosphate synthase pdxT subunit